MIRRIPPPILRTLQVLLALTLLALLWRVADGGRALALLADVHPGWLVAALAALTLQTVLSALRWRLAAAQLGISLDPGTALREYYLAQVVNQALPGGVLGDAGRAVRARAQAGLLPSTQAVIFERMAGQIALFVLFAAAVMPMLAVSGGHNWPEWLLPPVLALLAIGGAALLVLWRPEVWPRRAALHFREPCLRALAAPEVRVRQIGMSLGTALCNIAAFAICAKAIGLDLQPLDALVLVPLVLLSMVIPLTIGGWGLREGAAVALLPIAGATTAEALATSVVFGVAILAAALPGIAAIRLTAASRPVQT